jgi:hypothetical protein
MRLPVRISVLFFIGIFAVGSTALGYYYYFFYSPRLKVAEDFMEAMETGSEADLRENVVVSVGLNSGEFREPTDEEIHSLAQEPFKRGRIVDQRKREGPTRDYEYLVYREPDGNIFALVVTHVGGRYRIVIPEHPMSKRRRYLWDYAWTN